MTGADGQWGWPHDGEDPDQGGGYQPPPADGSPGGDLWSGYGHELEPGHGGDLWPGYGHGDELEPGHGGDLWPGYGDGPEPGYGGVDAHVDEPLGLAEAAGPDAGAADAAGPVFGAPDRLEPDGWADPQFPPPLALDPLPEPVDGPPWSDAGLLGSQPAPPVTVTGGTDVAALLDYAALDGPGGDDPGGPDGWAGLLAGDDPAAAALARWWAPPR